MFPSSTPTLLPPNTSKIRTLTLYEECFLLYMICLLLDVHTCAPFNQSFGNSSAYWSCNFTLCGGYFVTAGVCLNGGVFIGDTVLSLYDPMGQQVAVNDDSSLCGLNAVGSQLSYTPDASASCGNYTLHEYCYAESACSGTVVVVVMELSVPPSPRPTSEITMAVFLLV